MLGFVLGVEVRLDFCKLCERILCEIVFCTFFLNGGYLGGVLLWLEV